MRLLTKKAVAELTSYHAESIMRLVREGRFPQPIKLNGHSVRFKEDEVLAWLDTQPRAG